MKKIFKIIGFSFLGIFFLIFVILTLFLFTNNKPLPEGKQGEEADQLAREMLESLSYDSYKNTEYIEWTFRGKTQYQWFKNQGRCTVIWENVEVELNLIKKERSLVFLDETEYNGPDKINIINKALSKFNNDSFWLVAPFKVFDSGTERRLVKVENENDALLVTYTKGGNTPGDSYLWYLNNESIPIAYEMWVQKYPLGGIPATWEEWITTSRGAKLPQLHKIWFYELKLSSVQGI
ncbi:hypothetical protein OAR37_03805 [Flavobacteriaceae bacterium]|nr:hypothetical protein [Flavobacteriaceae bacterium]